jgi:hypothetical protein
MDASFLLYSFSALLLVTDPLVFIEYKDACAAELLPEIE